MKHLAKFGVVGLLLASLVASAFAFGGASNEAAKAAMESGDYSAWKEAMSSDLTEERFNQMRERHQEREEISAENRAVMDERRAAVNAAIESGSYNDWLSAIEGSPMEERMAELITEENFSTFVEMHQAMQKAHELSEELGIKGPGMGFGRHGRGMPHGEMPEE